MYYVLWTNTGQEEKTRQMIYQYADPALYSRIAIPYRLKRHYYNRKSRIVKLILFPSYIYRKRSHCGICRQYKMVSGFQCYPAYG